MSRSKKSIRLKVEDILTNEEKIMLELKQILQEHKDTRLDLWYNGINKKKLNNFSKKYEDIINSVRPNVSKKYDSHAYFIIQSDDDPCNNWKFKYIGNDVVDGIIKLKELLKITGNNFF